MTLRVKLEIAAAVLAALVGAVGLFAYQAERENRIRAEATTQAQKDVQKQIAQQVSDLAKQMSDRDALYKEQLSSLQARLSQAQSPQQIATLVAKVMGLKQPIQITTPLPTPQNPNPQPVAQVSLQDAPQVKAYVQTCEECKLNLVKTQADLADRAKQAELAQQTIDSLKKEKTSLQQALKGGTWAERAKKTTKVGAIGGAIVAAVICLTGHCK